MVTFAEDFRHLITCEPAVLAAVFAIETARRNPATALRVSALRLGHTTSDHYLTQIAGRSRGAACNSNAI
jgi:hypothetical protein